MMRTRKKGRKIYTYRVKNRRIFSKYHPMRSAFSMVLMSLFLVFFGIVGFNVAGPLVTRLQAEAKKPTTTPDPYVFTTTTPPVSAVTTATVTTQIRMTDTMPVMQQEPLRLALYLNANCVSDLDKLSAALSEASAAGYTAAVLPLRLEGGALQYSTKSELANECHATNEELPTLAEIAAKIAAADMAPIARIETISDTLVPTVQPKAGYHLKDSDQLWLDDSAAAGGKAWMSPFSEISLNYLQELTAEIVTSGFERVICSGIHYPTFYPEDMEAIGKQASDEEQRSNGLHNLLNRMATTTNVSSYEFDLNAALHGEEEALHPSALAIQTAVVTIDFRDFESMFYYRNERYDTSKLAYKDKVMLLLQVADEMTENLEVLPCICRGKLTDTQLQSVIDAMYEANYTEIYIQP